MATTNDLDSAAQTIDLRGLEQKTRQHQSLVDDTISKAKSLAVDMASSIDAMVTAALNPTDARGETPESLEVKSLAALQTQERKSEFLISLGEDKEVSSRLSNMLAEQFASASMEASQLAAKVSKRKSVGFFDNPLEFIWNQLQLPDEENALNAKVTEAKLAKDQIDGINRMESETAKNAEEYSRKLSIAGEQSKIQGLKNNFTIQAEQIKQQGIQTQAKLLETVMTADQKTLDNYHQIIQVRQSAAHLALSQEANSRSAVQFEQWKKDTADTEAGKLQQLEWINKGAELAGKPPLDQKQLLTLIKMSKGQLPLELNMMMERGYTASATGNTLQWGQTPTAAFEFAAATRSEVPNWLNDQLASAKKTLETMQAVPGAKPIKDKAEYEATINQLVKASLAKAAKEVDSRDETNPYLIPTTKVIAKNPTVAASPLFAKVLAPQQVDTRDINIIMARGLEAVKAGQIKFGELESGLDTYLKAGVALNNINNQFDRFAVPASSEYNYTSKVRMNSALMSSAEKAGFLSGLGTETVDLLDAGKRREYLIKRYQAGVQATPSSKLF